MSKNHMADVAKMLGVELGEEFELKDYEYNPYKITDGGLIDWQGDEWCNALTGLLLGEVEIIKKPWKPKEGETYYYITKKGNVCETFYSDQYINDLFRIRFGNCFRNREEAEANLDRWVDYLKQPSDTSWHIEK